MVGVDVSWRRGLVDDVWLERAEAGLRVERIRMKKSVFDFYRGISNIFNRNEKKLDYWQSFCNRFFARSSHCYCEHLLLQEVLKIVYL